MLKHNWLEGAPFDCATKGSLVIHPVPACQCGFSTLIPSKCTMRSWSFSIFAAFAVPASSFHIYLANMERQSFLDCDGIQTLDMLSLVLGPNKDHFSSSGPISDSCASSLSIFTDRASPHPPNVLVV